MARPKAGHRDAAELYFREVSRFQPLSSQEEAHLARRIRSGDRSAVEKLVKANLRFVASVARTYQNQGVPLMDLIGEGNSGLIRAAKRFDERKNFRFISYAVWWVRQAILQALARQSRPIRLPQNKVAVIYAAGKANQVLEQRLGRSPEPAEIAHEADLDEQDMLNVCTVGQRQLSLDAPMGSDSTTSLAELLHAGEESLPDSSSEEQALGWAVRSALDRLDQRERQVIAMSYGLGSEEPLTLDEIGLRLGITRERVRQVRERAFQRLREQTPGHLREALAN